MARPEDMRKSFKRNMNRLRLSDSIDLIKYTFTILLGLVGVVIIVALQPSLVMFVLILIPLRFLLILSVAIVANIFSTSAVCTFK
jgi:hypothetical protein